MNSFNGNISDDGDLFSEDEDQSQLGDIGSNGGQSMADRRAHHNALERKRRDHIKDSFSSLRDSVPSLQGEKASRAQILKKAAEYISYMRKKNNHIQTDIEEISKSNQMLEEQIRKMEASLGGSSNFSSLLNGDLSSSYDISENSNESDAVSNEASSLDGSSSLGGHDGNITPTTINAPNTAVANVVVLKPSDAAGLVEAIVPHTAIGTPQPQQQQQQQIIINKAGTATVRGTLRGNAPTQSTIILQSAGALAKTVPAGAGNGGPHVIHLQPSSGGGVGGGSVIISNGGGNASNTTNTTNRITTNSFVINSRTLANGTPIALTGGGGGGGHANATYRTVVAATAGNVGANGTLTGNGGIHIVSPFVGTVSTGPKTKKLKISPEGTATA